MRKHELKATFEQIGDFEAPTVSLKGVAVTVVGADRHDHSFGAALIARQRRSSSASVGSSDALLVLR